MSIPIRIFVRGVRLEAEVGVHPHERGTRQPLVIDITLETSIDGTERLSDTIDYQGVLETLHAVVSDGHIELVEGFAHKVASRLLEDARVAAVTIRIEKPWALAPQAEAAGVELTMTRDDR